jgi:hypothetical protein
MCILVINPLSNVELAKLFFNTVHGLFNPMPISFVVQKLYSFMYFHLLILSLNSWAICILFRKSLPMPISSSVFPTLSCTTFEVSGLILRSLIHFELVLVRDERYRSSFSYLHADIHFQHLLKRLSFLSCVFGTCIKNQEGVATWIHIWVFCSVPLVFTSALCQYQAVFIALAL